MQQRHVGRLGVVAHGYRRVVGRIERERNVVLAKPVGGELERVLVAKHEVVVARFRHDEVLDGVTVALLDANLRACAFLKRFEAKQP